MAVVKEGANGQIVKPYNGKLKNSKNMDLGDLITFESRYYGWIDGRIISIGAAPSVGDEYIIEFEVNGQNENETVEGKYL